MNYRVGDKVCFLNEQGGGIIRKVSNQNIAYVEIEHGFEIPVPFKELVKVNSSESDFVYKEPQETNANINSLSSSHFFLHAGQKSNDGVRKESKRKLKGSDLTLEIDLHIENLVNSHRFLTNGEIIVIQLNHFQSKLEYAIRKKMQKVIIIHGVGNGILKTEIRKILSNYSSISYYDAPFHKYGYGATEVRIY
jgi:dsDNA-specific endonuclease/ATPase MutS2